MPRRARRAEGDKLVDRIDAWLQEGKRKGAAMVVATALIGGTSLWAKSDSREALTRATTARKQVSSLEQEVAGFRPVLDEVSIELDDLTGQSDEINEAFARALHEQAKIERHKQRRWLRRVLREELARERQ